MLHPCLKTPIKEKEEPLGPDLVASSSLSEGAGEAPALTGFVKASRLISSKKEGEEGGGVVVKASRLVPSGEKEGGVATESRGEGKLSAAGFIPASQILAGQELRINSSAHGVTLSPGLTSR